MGSLYKKAATEGGAGPPNYGLLSPPPPDSRVSAASFEYLLGIVL